MARIRFFKNRASLSLILLSLVTQNSFAQTANNNSGDMEVMINTEGSPFSTSFDPSMGTEPKQDGPNIGCQKGSTCIFNGVQIGGTGNTMEGSGNGNTTIKDSFNGKLESSLDCSVQEKAESDFRRDSGVLEADTAYTECRKKFKNDPDAKQGAMFHTINPDDDYECSKGVGGRYRDVKAKRDELDAAMKKFTKAAEACHKKSFAKHDCSDSVTIEYLNQCKKDDKKCRDDKIAALKTDASVRESLEDKYDCKATSNYLDGLQGYSTAMNLVTTTMGVAAASKASQNVAAVAGANGNVLQSGFTEMAKANKKAAQTTLGMAAVDVAVATYAQIKARKHKKDMHDVMNSQTGADLLSEDDGGGKDLIERQAAAHQELVERANTLALNSGKNALMNSLQAMNYNRLSKQQQQTGQAYAPPVVGPNVYGNGYVPPSFNLETQQGSAANAYENNNAATDGGIKDGTPTEQGGISFGAAPGSNPSSGGLIGGAPGANNSMMASTGGGGGAAPTGSAATGGSGGDSAPTDAESEDVGSSAAMKYESGAGSGFASNSSNKHRMNDTGDMSGIGALLEKFLPKKEDEEKQGSILSFAKNGGPERGLASVEEDGSILGPNSNLFARVSNSMMSNFKKGNLK